MSILAEYLLRNDNVILYKIKELIRNGEDIHYCNDYPIRWASGSGRMDIVKYLVSLGAVVDTFENHAIGWASENGHIDIVKFLISVGANFNDYDDYAIKSASRNGHIELVKYLISIGANPYVISDMHKNIIFGGKIYEFYKRQSQRKKIIHIRNQLIPIYYHPNNKGGYFAKKILMIFYRIYNKLLWDVSSPFRAFD